MKEQLLEAIEVFGEKFDERVTIPSSSHILIVNEKAKQICEEIEKCSIQ